MKKIILIVLVVLSIGCTEECKNTEQYLNNMSIKICTIDSCEYVLYKVQGGRSITHKGNCKYCKERNNK